MCGGWLWGGWSDHDAGPAHRGNESHLRGSGATLKVGVDRRTLSRWDVWVAASSELRPREGWSGRTLKAVLKPVKARNCPFHPMASG